MNRAKKQRPRRYWEGDAADPPKSSEKPSGSRTGASTTAAAAAKASGPVRRGSGKPSGSRTGVSTTAAAKASGPVRRGFGKPSGSRTGASTTAAAAAKASGPVRRGFGGPHGTRKGAADAAAKASGRPGKRGFGGRPQAPTKARGRPAGERGPARLHWTSARCPEKKPTRTRLGRRVSGAQDPFPGPAPLADDKVKKFRRGGGGGDATAPAALPLAQERLKRAEAQDREASVWAARAELLLPEEPGFLEGSDGEDTAAVRQRDIADAVDIASAAKYFSLKLDQFGPYRLDYSATGRHLTLGGRRGHLAAFDWTTKSLSCEINVMEAVRDVRFLHLETLMAVAQGRWLHIYDNQGIELHCVRRCDRVTRLEFLPFHFLLATASETGFLTYLDVSVGEIVATHLARAGRLDVMAQNPHNAVVHLGHGNGTVTLWSPAVKEPLVKMLCHKGGVRAVAVDPTGTYMATSGLDRQLKLFDLRGAYRPLRARPLALGAAHLAYSQRGLLAASVGDVVDVYRPDDPGPGRPFLSHRLPGPVHGLRFCPFEDVLGVGHADGFSSLLVPGAGEPNVDGLANNPYRSKKQRQEWEVKALLEKIPAELIGLDPHCLGRVDVQTMEQLKRDKIERLGFDPDARTPFQPRAKTKGRGSAAGLLRRKRKVADQDKRELIRQSLQEKEREGEPGKKGKLRPPGSRPSALDRFDR
ncbi:WD repeat-containing protein 46 [Tachyglossus aculeatus]|uniref:WD repeat-containing protein 46 n=1 Tax=Tachyglossus aculeatus TaxID=9261 RepID=UPI0018F619DC|nr:WD repeat-containing protein 46 [Tachyglossus aculeatus]